MEFIVKSILKTLGQFALLIIGFSIAVVFVVVVFCVVAVHIIQ